MGSGWKRMGGRVEGDREVGGGVDGNGAGLKGIGK